MMNDETRNRTEDEIDLIQLVKTLWDNRKTIIRVTLVSISVGLFIALFSQKEYTASTTIVPQSTEGGAKLPGGLGGLAAIAGINLGSIGAGSDIPPSLYPKIVRSITFQKEIMQTPLSIEGQEQQVSFELYYLDIYKPSLLEHIHKYTFGLPGLIIKAVRSEASAAEPADAEGLINISEDEKKLLKLLEHNLSLSVNDKDGYVSLSASMPEPKAAAQLVLRAQELLQQAITNFKVQKTKDQLVFVEERYAEKQKEFDEAQRQLAEFSDRNKNVITAAAQAERERLQSNYNLIYELYSGLAKELETKKIQVKENTPVFTVIEPATVPIEKSKPKRILILLVSVFIGGILGVGSVLMQNTVRAVKAKWNEDYQ